MPGDFALPLFDAIESSGLLPLYTLSHEPSAGFAADASARMRGAVSVAAVTYGAGALNLVNAVAAAHAEKSPVVVLSGAPGALERRSGLLVHHQAKTLDWLKKGAVPSDTVKTLLSKVGVMKQYAEAK